MINLIFYLILLISIVNSIPFKFNNKEIPVPVVIWHGLGDRFDNPGLLKLKTNLESRFPNIFIHIITIGKDGPSDQRLTFFGNANDQIELVCKQLKFLPELISKELNPSGKFDAIGFSQGGQLLRGVIERCGGDDKSNSSSDSDSNGLKVRNLITAGSQHMGISALPPCPPDASPFSTCKLLHLSVVRNGLYSSFAQRNLIPAQYVRDEARIEEYLEVNNFLKDINNERKGDEEVGVPDEEEEDEEILEVGEIRRLERFGRRNKGEGEGDGDEEPARNSTYKNNLAALTNFVMLRFSEDATVVPPQSAHFTLPSPKATNCPSPSLPTCYLDPVPYTSLPLFVQDYIGLKILNERKVLKLDLCLGGHMEINVDCWEKIVSWLGEGKGVQEVRREDVDEGEAGRKFVIQL